jgi:hypothetical protein
MAVKLHLLASGLVVAAAAAAATQTDGIKALNQSLGGRVHRVEPFALPCFSDFEGELVERDEELCAERQANYKDPIYRMEIPGAYMYEQTAICASDPESLEQCLLDENDPTNADAWTGRSCRLGNLPSWYIQIMSANDVVEAFNYARNTGGKLSIKNSGHTYVEDSSQKDSLLLWTRGLQHLSRDTQFIPQGCSADDAHPPADTITTGAGVSCGEVYEYAHSEEVNIICGYSPTVGISGGWVQGAGHSVLTNVYGLGVDRVLQFTIVTPDGSVRIANRCQNTDLFWALRGGGGGTYGVVLDSTHLVDPVVPMAVASVGIPKDDKDVYGDWMDLMVDTAIELAKDGWGGHVYGNSFVHVTPLLTTAEEAEESLSEIVDFANANGGHVAIEAVPDWYTFFQKYVLSGSVSVGNLNIINTRLIPTAIFESKCGKQSLKKFFRDLIAEGGSPYIPVDSPYLFKTEEGSTSVHPAWYESLWMLGQPSYWQWNSTLDERIAVAQNMQSQTVKQQALTPGGATYKNEGNPFTLNWKETWYGENYDELLALKNKYDPNGLLSCWGCIGWTEEDAQNSCYSAFADLQPL